MALDDVQLKQWLAQSFYSTLFEWENKQESDMGSLCIIANQLTCKVHNLNDIDSSL